MIKKLGEAIVRLRKENIIFTTKTCFNLSE